MRPNMKNFKVPKKADDIQLYFKTVPLSKWSLWDYGAQHPEKQFSVLKSKYISNLDKVKSLDIKGLSRHVEALIKEVKRCRAAEWKERLRNHQLRRTIPWMGGEKITQRTLRRKRCWEVNGFSLSIALHRYRNKSIDLLSRGDVLSTLRKLSLNGIFLIQPSPPPSSSSASISSSSLPLPSPPLPPVHQEYGVTDAVWQQALAEAKGNYNTLPAVSVNVGPFLAIADMAKHDRARAITMLGDLRVRCFLTPGMKPLSEYTGIVLDFFHRLNNRDATKLEYKTFCILVVEPIILPFMMSNECEFSGKTTPSNGSKARKDRGCIPDISLRLDNSCLMLVYIKSEPHRINNPDDDSDFIKLANMMKDELDVWKGESKVCYGVLIRGLEMSTFSLDLSYFKLYRLTLLDTAKLPASTADLFPLLSCFQALNRLKALVDSLASSFRSSSSSSSNLSANPPQDASDDFTLTSFPSPRL